MKGDWFMKVPLNWLKDYVDINVDIKKFCDAMTLSGSKVEGVEVQGAEISNVVVGKILTVEKHPNADKLLVSQVDVGTETIQVVTGAKNIKVGDYIPVALHGATLPGGVRITRGKLRGIESNGMMCSINELGLTRDDYPNAAEDGIFILEGEHVPGTDIKKVLGLEDSVIEFEITSNRPDCLSIVGIAREAAATLGTEFKMPEIKFSETEDESSNYISVKIEAPDLCPRFAGRIVKNVKIQPSPKWMRDRLRAAGVRPINNIVDITNYVMLELGQPMHAYDLDYIKGPEIIVRRARDGETMMTLDGQERVLDSSMLVISDAERAVGVAGVMGGANSEISDDTKTILFEAANFDGTSVRLTAKKLGMRTEASSRFEKGQDAENVMLALNRAVQLVEELGAGTVCRGAVDCYVRKKERKVISFDPDKINAFLGTNIERSRMFEILRKVECEVDEENLKVTVPTFRPDLERWADLAEEIARFHDYNNIEATLFSGKTPTLGRKTRKQKIEDIIRNTMVSCGLYETCTYSFTSPKVFDRIRLPEDSPLRKAVPILNPLGEDYSIMRTTTLPHMLENISRNYNRRAESARLFEISFVYLPESVPVTTLPEEKPVLTIGMYGDTDFYELKGIVEELMMALGIKKYDFEPERDNPSFHPGRTASVLVNGKKVGVIGEVHPIVSENFETPERTYVGMLEIEPLVANADMRKEYKPLPKYPAVSRDIALLVKDEIPVRQIDDIIKKKGGSILESFKLFDVYKGRQVAEGMKSVAYSITFRAADRTLTDDEVNRVMEKILESLKADLGAQLRV